MKKLALVLFPILFMIASPAHAADLKCNLRVTGTSPFGPIFSLVPIPADPRDPSIRHIKAEVGEVVIDATATPAPQAKIVTPDSVWREIKLRIDVYHSGILFFSGTPKLLLNENAPDGSLKTDTVNLNFSWTANDQMNPGVTCYYE